MLSNKLPSKLPSTPKPKNPNNAKPKPLIDQIGDELTQAGIQVYSYEKASETRNQEHQLLTNQINYTNQQIHFFKQCYIPQILESLYNGKIGNEEQARIHEKLYGYLVSVENSLAEIEHPKDVSGTDSGGKNSSKNQIHNSSGEILTLDDAKKAFLQTKNEFNALRNKFQEEKRKNIDLKNQQTEAVENYMNNISKIDDCVVQLKQLFDCEM